DYVVVKFPKWPFDKFVYAKRTLGTQMKATGEVMAIGTTFEQAMMKAVRGVEIGMNYLSHKKYRALSDEEITSRLHNVDDERLFIIFEALRRDTSIEEIHEITMIDEWFLAKLRNLVKMERVLVSEEITKELYHEAKKLGFPDKLIEELSGKALPAGMHERAVYKVVDTCAAEFSANTPYFYSTYDDENEAAEFIEAHKDPSKKTVIVFGSGPIRIGQGIEFDYASVHCVWSLKKAGYDVVIVNNNPETVSTDFDTADRLYFEPLTNEDVMNIIETEKPYGVVVAFGGQTAIKLTKFMSDNGVNILGTSADSIDAAEDRERFDELLEANHVARPEGFTVMTTEEALTIANRIGYPVLMRPSYVLGGQNMIIAFTDDDIKEYMAIILSHNIENPVLIDKYLMGIELEVDAICDGDDILIPGIMEHVERTGIHSGDSIAVYPSWNITDKLRADIIDVTRKLSVSLKIMGLVNIQYLISNADNKLYVIEVNPRSSRTIPYISKVTGVPMVDLATRCMLGEKLADMGYGTGLYKTSPYVAVKVPVFSFEKLMNVDNHLGPEMKSTGEVLGLASTREEALYKGLVAAGYKLKKQGGIFITVRDADKAEIGETAKRYYDLGFELYATRGTAKIIEDYGMKVTAVDKIHEGENNTLKLIESGKVDYVISTSAKGRIPTRDSVKIRRKAVERAIPCLTSIDTANAVADCLKSRYSQICTELVNINDMRTEKASLEFTKMEACGNDYIYFNCFNQRIDNPEGLSIRLADRHFGIGGDGVVLMYPSEVADVKMRMFNLDGTEGRLCGNAARCIAKYMIDNGMVKGDTMTIETLSGIRPVTVEKVSGEVSTVTINMGKAELHPSLIPVKLPGERAIGVNAKVAGDRWRISCVSMGNPHCVVFSDDFSEPIDSLDLETIGPKFENDPIFPERVNTEFIKVLNPTTLKMRVWERGSGETFACGSGACAAVVAAVENGFCPKDTDITVKLIGGDLKIRYTSDAVYLTGDAVKVYEGKVVL
ncbi:MAG: carbamoyl-phosphate synthase large subunit, partial [Clostridia bacterium]|nr:carbamoyl-phosphate synthase large subunit [Clostridia bacterium]